MWITALMFFQLWMLLGYLYAHGLGLLGDRRLQMGIHAVLLLLALAALPLTLPAIDPDFAALAPIRTTLLALVQAIGLPFFFLAATAPLVQHWFSRSGHADAKDPYHLYAASNAGSLIALGAFPLLLEPMFALNQQRAMWAVGFGIAGTLILSCGLFANTDAPKTAAHTDPQQSSGWRWEWFALSAIPSSLLSGVTLQITTDVASVPLLWVIPLALYLITFILAFAQGDWLPPRLPILVAPVLLIPILARAFGVSIPEPAVIGAELMVFFLVAFTLHHELAQRRPPAAHLTRFYLAISFGGFLGGAFNALVAPAIFDTVVEFPLALALAMALRPSDKGGEYARILDIALPVGLAVLGYIAIVLAPGAIQGRVVEATALGLGAAGALFAFRAIRLGLAVACTFTLAAVVPTTDRPLVVERDFFGVTAVLYDAEKNTYVLRHGNTEHGGQYRDPERRREMVTYYWKGGPLHDVFEARATTTSRIAAVGLGAGVVACNAKPGQTWTFFEISPVVIKFARDTRLFSFLNDCAPDAEIVLGDARQQLAGRDATYDLIVLDAFSSDSVPVHLITHEAFDVYLNKLADDGVIAIHISNRFLDLRPVAADLAAHHGLEVRCRTGYPDPKNTLHRPARYCVFARTEATLGSIAIDEEWATLEVRPRLQTLDGRPLKYPRGDEQPVISDR